MQKYIARRILLGFLTAILVSVMVFTLMRVAPGDVALMIVEGQAGDYWTQEQYDAVKLELGLDRAIHLQYFDWIGGMLTGDWGESLFTGQKVWDAFKTKIAVTLELAILSVVISVVMGIPAGILMAVRQDTWVDYFLRIFSLAGLSIPNFWIATIVIAGGLYLFSWGPSIEYKSLIDDPVSNLKQLFWPAMIGGYSAMATKARMMRSTMLEVLRQDYIRTAHSKGLTNLIVVYRHAMKNALIPVVTVIGITIAFVVGGSVIMERVFLLPGVGSMLVTGMNNRDFPVVQSLVLFFTMWIVVINLLVDLSYGFLDPRIRYN